MIDSRADLPQQPRKLRTALLLASVAAAFFVGVIMRHWLW
jgi:hypothetical protein